METNQRRAEVIKRPWPFWWVKLYDDSPSTSYAGWLTIETYFSGRAARKAAKAWVSGERAHWYTPPERYYADDYDK